MPGPSSTGPCGITFLSENLMDQAVLSLTTGTANAQFPLDNIKNEATAVKFRSNENTVVILADLQQTRTLDSFAIHGDSNEEFGVTNVSIKTSLTTDFSSSTAINIPVSAANLMGYEYFTSVDHRYVEITLTGSGSFAEVSNIFIGARVNIEQNNLSIGAFRYGTRDRSTVNTNRYGQRFVDKRNALKFLGGRLEFCTKSEQETLDNMFLRHLRSEPIWMIVDKESSGMNEGQYKLAIYGYFEEAPQWTASGGNHYNINLRVNQAG